MSRFLILILVAALFASLLASCGGGGDDPPPTKAAFIKEADKICNEMDARVIAGLSEFAKTHPEINQGPTAKKATSEFVTTIVLPEIQKQAEEIGALQPPEGDEKELDAFVSEIEAGVKETEQGDVTRVFTNDRGKFQQVYRMGEAYGFKICKEAL